MPKKSKKNQLYLTDSIGILNLVVASLSVFVLFFGIFNADGLNATLYPIPFLIAFATCAYIARARLLGFKGGPIARSFMIGVPIVAIVLCIWGIIFAL